MDLQTKWVGEEKKKKETISLLPFIVLIPIFFIIILFIRSSGSGGSGEGLVFTGSFVLIVSTIVMLPFLIYNLYKDTLSSIKHPSEGGIDSKRNKASIIINIGLSIFLVGIIV